MSTSGTGAAGVHGSSSTADWSVMEGGRPDYRLDNANANANSESVSVSGGSRFWSKAQENPFLPAGILLGLGALGYSGYKFRTRAPGTKLSVYLIHTRLGAQGAVVTAITAGVLWSMFNEYVLEPKNKK